MDPSAPSSDDANAPVDAIAAMAAGVLRVPAVDPATTFLEAGGDSIDAAQLVARLHDAFGVEITIRDLYDAPSLAAIATLVEERVIAQIELADINDDGNAR